MLSYLSITLLLGAFTVTARPIDDVTAQKIDWFPCPENTSWPIDCGTLKVPLDYTDSSSELLTLSLVRANATAESAKGSILFNPGGPGEPGRDFMLETKDHFLNITGGQYNLISFDPRGTGDTLPFACYDSFEAFQSSAKTYPHSANESSSAIEEIWAYQKTYSQTCLEKNKDHGDLIGTGFVARDMMQIVDALDEDKLLRYWGFSYGTLLGATVAAMYPDRMDKVVLDGNVNVFEYYHASANKQELTGTDSTLDKFCEACVNAPSGACSLAEDGTSASQLCSDIYSLFDYIKENSVAYGTGPDDVYKYGLMKNLVFQNLYNLPGQYSKLAQVLNQTFIDVQKATSKTNVNHARSTESEQPATFPHGPYYDALAGIKCSDNTARTNDLKSLIPAVQEQEDISRLAGDLLAAQDTLTCGQWQFQAKGAYTGNFQIKTRNPVLFIGSPFDPITPLVSAQNVSAGFEGSVVLEHNGVGHTSQSQQSSCVHGYVQSYFVDGTLPAKGTKCQAGPQFWGSVSSGMEKRWLEKRNSFY